VGDRIVGINGNRLEYFDLFVLELQNFIGQNIVLNAERNGSPIDFDLEVPETGKIGVFPADPKSFFDYNEIKYGFLGSIPAGVDKGVNTIKSYLKDLKLVFTPETKAYKSLGGFIAIGNIFPGKWDWHVFWNMTAFLSIMLAILNVLPIPALDGGHVIFLIFEMITGRKPSDKFMEIAQIVGMLLLLALVLYANGNDIIKMFAR